MKEATGEANIPVITIVLIAIVLAVGTFLVNQLLQNTARKAACTGAGGTLYGNTCTVTLSDGKKETCTLSKCTKSNAYECKAASGSTLIRCPE